MWPVGRRRFKGLALAAITAALLLQPSPAHATNDEYWDRQWGPRAIHVEDAWAAGATGAGVKVGVVDTGVDLNHPEFAGQVAATANCIGGTCVAGGQDDGTH